MGYFRGEVDFGGTVLATDGNGSVPYVLRITDDSPFPNLGHVAFNGTQSVATANTCTGVQAITCTGPQSTPGALVGCGEEAGGDVRGDGSPHACPWPWEVRMCSSAKVVCGRTGVVSFSTKSETRKRVKYRTAPPRFTRFKLNFPVLIRYFFDLARHFTNPYSPRVRNVGHFNRTVSPVLDPRVTQKMGSKFASKIPRVVQT